MRDPRERLQDVLEAIERIERYAARGREAFEKDELIQNWFVRHLQIIGEAARVIPTTCGNWRRIFHGKTSSVCGTSSCTITSGLTPMWFGELSRAI